MSSNKERKSELRIRWKMWLEPDRGERRPRVVREGTAQESHETRRTREPKRPVFGQGIYVLLRSIQETGAITRGAESLGMSYRYAWGLIRAIEREFGITLLETRRGGSDKERGVGGGGAMVTEDGLRLMKLYADAVDAFDRLEGEMSPRS